MGSLCLDKRLCFNLNYLSATDWKRARNVLKEGYVDFNVQCKVHERKELAKKTEVSINLDQPLGHEIMVFSDEDDSDIGFGSVAEPTQESSDLAELEKDKQKQRKDAHTAAEEFAKVIKRWKNYIVPRKRLYPDLKFEDPSEHLMKLDLKPLMDEIEKHNYENENVFGYLLLMCICSKFQLGTQANKIFHKQIKFYANLVVQMRQCDFDGDFDGDFIEKNVILKMNNRLMK